MFLTKILAFYQKEFRKRVSSHIWQPSNIFCNPAIFNERERNRKRLHPKPLNPLIK